MPDINQCWVNQYPSLTCLAGTFHRVVFHSSPLDADANSHETFTPGGAASINRRARPKSRATTEACVVLRSGFQILGCVSLSCTDIFELFSSRAPLPRFPELCVD
ncbi:predicted protein [Ostreococcus lucimarinus CCE9901]|uniref:Uncharacterized protein n=1 Tax=Ostreococcus lucimarinus (strain CCE9901) TaxID=436017 RepID=A4S9K5_OSTLU|nr:predicted protein [Ostreococcus lucimarinus CCE9901]ABP00502.1 predicted protein [Ostreococcus lucimarinus CCE9901]|eukprot:XP_001422185.1 predicted protein [Ostreococcus lucimarinus CCE9901]